VTSDLLHRIRWTNVARAGAVVLALLLALAWPRLRAHPDPLPPTVEPAAAAKPSAVAPPARVAKTAARAAARSTPGRAGTPKHPAVKRPAVRRRVARRHRHARHRTPPSPRFAAPAVVAAPAYIPPRPAPAPAAEFRP
jgi:hypothetical protein